MLRALGQKLFMTSYVNEEGKEIPATVIFMENPLVLNKLQTEKGNKLVLGYFTLQNTKGFTTSLMNNNFRKQDKKSRFVLESTIKDNEQSKIESAINNDEIEVQKIILSGQKIDVKGFMKGRGFTGGMKRHGFSGQNRTHGCTLAHRVIGSTGSCKPSRTLKGKKMAGRHGGLRYTKNLTVLNVINKNFIVIKGSIAGCKNSIVEIVVNL